MGGASSVKRGKALRLRFVDVCRLKRLGFFLGFGGGGLTNAAGEVEVGENICGWADPSPIGARLRARPFALRGLRGDGEVMGRSYPKGFKWSDGTFSDIVRSSNE